MGAESDAQGTAALIDNKSIAVYRKEFENQRLLYRNATEAEICLRVKEYIKQRLNGIVDEECRKRVMDLTTVALSCLSSMVIPFTGVAVVVAATLIQCLDFSITLGLIPLLNVRSFNDLGDMSKKVGRSIKNSGKSSVMAGVETAVLEILKNLGLGDWLWTEILRDILIEMIGDSAMDVAWIMTPLLAVPKYMMHRHLIKKMYRKLGDKAEIIHTQWMEENCVTKVTVQTTVVTQVAGGVQVDASGNVQGTYIQTQEVCATQVATNSGAQTNGYYQQQAKTQQWSPYPYSSQAPCYNHNTNPVMMPGTAPSYAPQPQPQQMPPATGANYFQPQAAVQQTGTVIMGYTPPANSSYFQPQPAANPTGTVIMGHEPPTNSSFFQPQVGGQFQPRAVGYYQAAAAAQTYTPPPNPTYVQQLPAYATQQVQHMYPQGQPQGYPYVQMGEYIKPQAQMACPPAGAQQAYPPNQAGYQPSAPQPDLWYQAKAN